MEVPVSIILAFVHLDSNETTQRLCPSVFRCRNSVDMKSSISPSNTKMTRQCWCLRI